MLQILKVKNFALIDEVEIPFTSGLNILSGETGAGKSILLAAISLVLGGRAHTESVRKGAEEAIVEGLFSIADLPWMSDRLRRHGFESEGSQLLIKRVVSLNGRHRIYINGELATLSILQDVCDGLVDLCGQHEHQSLLRPVVQMEMLDRYAGLEASGVALRKDFSYWNSLKREKLALSAAEEERLKKADFLQFQIEELRGASLELGEDERLAEEKKLLQSSGNRIQLAQAAYEAIDGEGEGALERLRLCSAKLRNLLGLDETAAPILESVNRALIEIEDSSRQLSRYVQAIDLSESRLQEVQERLALVAGLRRKYGATVGEMLSTLHRLEGEFQGLGKTEERLSELQGLIEKVEAELLALGKKLHQHRVKAAKLLSDSVTGELSDLRMQDACFTLKLNFKEKLGDWNADLGPNEIDYLIRTNAGEEQKPLGKIASGGELSRVMLAIRRVIADKGGIGVYLFDEIDAGIGGQTAFTVGKKLSSVAKYNQVICITHLPQVAAFGAHHLSVRKQSKGGRTVTTVEVIEGQERVEEIARMLGGPKVTPASVRSAKELLQHA